MQTPLVSFVLLSFVGGFGSPPCTASAADGAPSTPAAASDRKSVASPPPGLAGKRIYEVRKRVTDFPDHEDLPTPEAAYAAMHWAWIAEGDNGQCWLRLSSPENAARLTQQGFRAIKQPLSKEETEPILNAEILEVRICDENHAAVIARMPFKGHDLHLCWFKRVNEHWLYEGTDLADTIEQARKRINTGVINRTSSFSWPQSWRRLLIENMNNPVVLSFGDGTAFFAGVTAVVIALLLLMRFRTRLVAALLFAVALIGIAVAISSATPLPVWAYAVWLSTVAATVVLCLWRPTRKARIASGSLLLVTSIGLCAAEIPYHLFPRVHLESGKTVYVLGDSLSAGVGVDRKGRPCPKLRCWPAVLGDMTQLAVVNLATPGAKVGSAMAQAKRARPADAAVIIEIGGNDFFSDAAMFREHLDSLVCSLQDHRPILMFELPLFPFQNAFGQAQREVAAKYGVILIPKRCLTAIWGRSGSTLDGLHFSQAGHNTLARMVAEVLDVEDGASPHEDSTDGRSCGPGRL